MRYAINGLGRIGRALLRILWERNIDSCVFINDVFMDIDNVCYLLKYDSLHGPFKGNVTSDDQHIIIFDESRMWKIKMLNWGNSKNFRQNECSIDLLVEATGNEENFTSIKYLSDSGFCKQGIITYAHEPTDFSLIIGVNDKHLNFEKHKLISTSICDVTALAPVLKIVNEDFGIESCFITSLHPWLSYQNVLDGPVRSQQYASKSYNFYHLGRMSTEALIPKTTTMGSILPKILPELAGKLITYSYRVPTSKVCSADISLILERPVSKEKMIDFLKTLSSDIISVNEEKLISTDFGGSAVSCIIDLNWVEVNKNMLKLVLWYDNEWGYSSRVADAIVLYKNYIGGNNL